MRSACRGKNFPMAVRQGSVDSQRFSLRYVPPQSARPVKTSQRQGITTVCTRGRGAKGGIWATALTACSIHRWTYTDAALQCPSLAESCFVQDTFTDGLECLGCFRPAREIPQNTPRSPPVLYRVCFECLMPGFDPVAVNANV